MPEFPFQDGQIHYTDQGEGEKNLVLVHGFADNLSVWEGFTGKLQEAGVRVICIDLPGVGGSASVSSISLDQFGDAVAQLVKHLALAHFVLIGHSLGGYTTLNAIRRYPKLPCLGFGLFHSHPYADTAEIKLGRTETATFIGENGSSAFARNFCPTVFAEHFAERNPSVVSAVVNKVSAVPPQPLIGQLLAMRDRKDETATLHKASVPVLFILGKEDNLFPLDRVLPPTLMPQTSSVHVLEGVGHMGMLEAREACQEMVTRFVALAYQEAGLAGFSAETVLE